MKLKEKLVLIHPNVSTILPIIEGTAVLSKKALSDFICICISLKKDQTAEK